MNITIDELAQIMVYAERLGAYEAKKTKPGADKKACDEMARRYRRELNLITCRKLSQRGCKRLIEAISATGEQCGDYWELYEKDSCDARKGGAK